MKEVEILNSRKYNDCRAKNVFDIFVRVKDKKDKGKLTIYTNEKRVEVDMGRPITDLERIHILSEIFYRFCVDQGYNDDICYFRFFDKFDFEEKMEIYKELKANNLQVHTYEDPYYKNGKTIFEYLNCRR